VYRDKIKRRILELEELTTHSLKEFNDIEQEIKVLIEKLSEIK